jgi:hypothetical protein
VRGGGVDQSVAQRLHPDAAGLQRGDDVDQVAEVASEAVDAPHDQGVAAAQVGQAGVPVRSVGLGSAGVVGVDLQAARSGERIELELGILIRRRHARIPNLGHAGLYRISFCVPCCVGLF